MSDGILVALTVISAIGSGVVAGVFFAFSAFIMKGFAQLPPAQGIAAMQAINRAAPSPLFMGALFGTALTCATLAISSLFMWNEPIAIYWLVGGILYFVTILLTVTYHVPRNEALATVDPSDPGAAGNWNRYLSGWTAWNHVRTATSLAAAITLTIAFRV